MQDNKNILYKILAAVFMIIFAVSAGLAVRNYMVKKNANEILDQMAKESTVETEQSTVEETILETQTEEADILEQLGITVPQKNLDWDELYAQNEDIYAWIYIPNTQIDYPVLQHPTDPDYYIDYNIDGTKGYPGCICTQYYNSKDFKDPNTIVYGHNMKNGTMFKTLHNFEDGEFFDENQYVYIYTPDITYVYEIFAACTVSDDHLMSAYNFWDMSEFNSFVSDVRTSKGMTNQNREDVTVSYGDYLLTLSTCISGQSNKRWIVVCKRLN
jgi:sortase B